MVCVQCNGKGYRIINDIEVACDECQGHGEHLVPGREDQTPSTPTYRTSGQRFRGHGYSGPIPMNAR